MIDGLSVTSPSSNRGHTLHAVSFALVVSAYFPLLAWVLAPFALRVALSRMILGLHYPTNVLIGAAIDAGLAWPSKGLLFLS